MQATAIKTSSGSITTTSLAHGAGKPREIKVSVTERGFVPSSMKAKAGERVVLAITRKTDQTCAKQAVFPSLGKTLDLPLNKTVRVALQPASAGRIDFACGMGMMKAQVIVQ